MKLHSQKQFATLALGGLMLGLLSAAVHAGSTNLLVATRNPSAKPTPAKSDTVNGNPATAPAPQSVFMVPRKVAEGKDPFFPNSSRVYGTETVTKGSGPAPIVADISLKGISGTPEQPLAIINTTTCTTGETAEIITKNSRIKVQCLEINMAAGTVLLQIGGERRELRLAPLK